MSQMFKTWTYKGNIFKGTRFYEGFTQLSTFKNAVN